VGVWLGITDGDGSGSTPDVGLDSGVAAELGLAAGVPAGVSAGVGSTTGVGSKGTKVGVGAIVPGGTTDVQATLSNATRAVTAPRRNDRFMVAALPRSAAPFGQ
jgi:hypothetical protein